MAFDVSCSIVQAIFEHDDDVGEFLKAFVALYGYLSEAGGRRAARLLRRV
jgi:hypothetical protein